jgi:hypothetical protein
MEYDSSLRDRLGIAIFDAILEVSTPPNGSQPVLSTGAAFDALLMVAATTIARSSGCGTPQAARVFSEGVAKKLRLQILAAKQVSDFKGSALFLN